MLKIACIEDHIWFLMFSLEEMWLCSDLGFPTWLYFSLQDQAVVMSRLFFQTYSYTGEGRSLAHFILASGLCFMAVGNSHRFIYTMSGGFYESETPVKKGKKGAKEERDRKRQTERHRI